MQGQADSRVLAATPDVPLPEPDSGPPRPKTHRRRLVILLASVASFVVVLIAGGILANIALTQTYSPRQAVTDYFAALRNRDANGMLANATFLRGEGAYSYFFGKLAVVGMLQRSENSDIHNVRITSDRVIDDSSHAITISMTWHGTNRTETFTVRKDTGRTHFVLYPSWRVEIPSTRIQVQLPKQAGIVNLDGIPAATENPTSLQAIEGFHEISMSDTDLYTSDTQIVDATGASVSATLKGTIRASALQLANEEIKRAAEGGCDATKYSGCFGHTYPAPNHNLNWYMPVPGYGDVPYNSYVIALTGDPTSGMTLTVEGDTGKVSVSGTCTSTLTIDGARKYSLKGTFSGTLTWTGGGFSSNVVFLCAKQQG